MGTDFGGAIPFLLRIPPYLLKDIRNYISQGDIVGFNKMLRLISAQIGNLLNVNEVSLASGLPRRTCEEYLYILEQMGIIKLLEPYFVTYHSMINYQIR
ncbi:hypothetical protein FACS1894109_01150 [Spirochaetia bacterium]|nr:hypothetical protein FACS1894109_01150 [Spirochaetia bacterium]